MPFRVCEDAGETIFLPVDTKVYANPGAAKDHALTAVKEKGVLYACDAHDTYRWHGTLRTNKVTTFVKVMV